MRLSSLSILVVLLFSSLTFAQHHNAGGAPSTPPPPSPSPSRSEPPSPAPAPSPSPSFAPSSAPSVSTTHASAPSSPAAEKAPESHGAPSVNSSGATVSNSTRTESNSPKSDTAHFTEGNTERVIPDQRISGENRITGTPRIGQNPPEKEGNVKPAEPDLRHRICEGGPCKEPSPKPVAPESDLRKRICINGPCTCPPGQTVTKGGCVVTVLNNAPEVHDQCQSGQYWNGAACQLSERCQPGLYWNGAACVLSAAECAGLNARASGIITELHALRARLEQACRPSPPSQECDAIKLERAGTRQRYQMMLTEGPARCATALPDPSLFYDEFQ